MKNGSLSGILLDGMEELAEYDAFTTARIARYDHDPSRVDALLAQTASGSKVNAVSDALGSVYGLTDAASDVVSRYSYDVYGARTATAEAIPTKWGFTGRVHEADAAGAMYYRNRHFDATTGTWISADPSGMPEGPNRYLYLQASPTIYRDPYGFEAGPECPSISPYPEYPLVKNIERIPVVIGYIPIENYRLSVKAIQLLQPIFDNFSFDVAKVRFDFGLVAKGYVGWTAYNYVILSWSAWQTDTPSQKLGLLAHEMTHSVQFERIGGAEFVWRYFPELVTPDNYIPPAVLLAIPLAALNPVDPRFTLDQIASRVTYELYNSYGP